MAGYFEGCIIISREFRLMRFAELIFAKLIENHTHVPSVATSRLQSSWKVSFREICEIIIIII